MTSVFSDSTIFKQIEVTLNLSLDSSLSGYSERGNPIVVKSEITLLFKIKPLGYRPISKDDYASSNLMETYNAYLVATNGDFSLTTLPPNIMGAVGTGSLDGNEVQVMIEGISQSSVSPILAPILGDRARLKVIYKPYMNV